MKPVHGISSLILLSECMISACVCVCVCAYVWAGACVYRLKMQVTRTIICDAVQRPLFGQSVHLNRR